MSKYVYKFNSMSLAGFTFRNKATSISDGPCCLIFVSTETAQLSFHCVRCVQCVRACCFADLVDSFALPAEYASRLEYDSDVWTLDVQTLQASRTGGFVEAHCANNRLRTSFLPLCTCSFPRPGLHGGQIQLGQWRTFTKSGRYKTLVYEKELNYDESNSGFRVVFPL